MQRLGSPWRLLGLSRKLSYAQIRFAGTRAWRRRRQLRPGQPLRESYPIFDFPELVLDLDAENSPHVRPVNEADWQREIDKYAVNPAVEAAAERVLQFEKESDEARKFMMSTAHQRFSMWQVSDMDVLSVALGGSPRNQPASDTISPQEEQKQKAFLDQLLRQNGITDRIMSQDDTKVIRFMMHRQSLAQKVNPFFDNNDTEIASINAEDVQFLESVLSRCGFYQMQHLISRIAQTESGCQLLSRCGEKISKLSHQFLRDGMEDEVLILLNNLIGSLQLKNVDIGEALCSAGLRTSMIAAHAPAVLRYIGLSHELGYHTPPFSVADLQTSLEKFCDAYSRNREGLEGAGSRPEYRAELLTVLTGRSVASYVPQASFRASIGSTMEFIRAYNSYIVLLGELGALRMLWHEWHTLKTMKGQLAFELRHGPKHQLFANALAHCASSLQSQRISFTQEDYTTVTGDYAEDAALDLQSIYNQKLRMIRGTLAEPLPSTFENTAAMAEQLREQIRKVFRVPNIEDAMRDITALMSITVAGK